MSKYLRWAELPAREDVYGHVGTTSWGNHDLYPIPKKEKTFGWFSFFAYTIICGVNITDYSLGSSYIAVGLTAGETVGLVLVGSTLAGAISYVTARPGLDHGIGFTMWLRTVFGLRGSFFPLTLIFISGIIFAGLQAYYGGLAICVALSAIIPQFAFMENTLPASAGITTQQLIGFLLYFIFYIPFIWIVKPHQLRKYLYPGFVLVVAVMFGLLIWAIRGNNGSVGTLMTSSPVILDSTDKAFRVAQCIITVVGQWGGASERFSDWTRFSKTRQSPTLAMCLGMPLGITFSALIGALVTSATYQSTGVLEWNPLVLLSTLQTTDYSPAVRAGTFFAGASLFLCQLVVNMANNTVGCAMDVCGVFPRYFSMKRAAILLVILTIVAQPWRFLGQAYIFVEILSITSIFFSASCSIMTSDYYLVRKRKLVIPDLFIGSSESIYWFTEGINWRAVTSLFLAMWPAIPGLAFGILQIYNNWTRVFQINYVVCAPIGFLAHLAFSFIWKPKGLGIQTDLPEQGALVDGVAYDVSGDEKVLETIEVGTKSDKVSEV